MNEKEELSQELNSLVITCRTFLQVLLMNMMLSEDLLEQSVGLQGYTPRLTCKSVIAENRVFENLTESYE